MLDNLPERKLFSGGSPSLEFDEHLTSTARLSIISALISGESLSFMELKRETGLADGNLHVQTRKLAEAGYLEIRKVSRGRRSATSFRVSELGVAALKHYVRGLREAPVPPRDGRKSVEMIVGAYRSAAEGRRVTFPLAGG